MSATNGQRLAIAQIGTVDEGGGAAAVAGGLMRGYVARGHRVWHLVGRKQGRDPNVVVLPDDDRLAYRASGYTALQSTLGRLAGRFPRRGFGAISRSLRLMTHPVALANRLRGVEDFDFPGSARLVERLGAMPDVVQGHNLHGGYFDLRALASISRRVPTFLTLHDMWLLTGHCAHSLGCDRWKTGCGRCPDLRLEPAVRRDATDGNWRRKQDVLARSRLLIATPSAWLRDQVLQSMLAPLVQDVRVIPNGVDTGAFRPGSRAAARAALGLPAEARIVLLTIGRGHSMWKDDAALAGVVDRIAAARHEPPVVFVSVGGAPAFGAGGRAALERLPLQRDPQSMARCYQAADLYLHAARADTFPLAVLEAMACGTPVVATKVGGIPEQIRSAGLGAVREGRIGDATGMLVPAGAAADMAEAATLLLERDEVRERLAANAVSWVQARCTLERQVETYLDWYQELVGEGAAARAQRANRGSA